MEGNLWNLVIFLHQFELGGLSCFNFQILGPLTKATTTSAKVSATVEIHRVLVGSHSDEIVLNSSCPLIEGESQRRDVLTILRIGSI